MQGSSFHVTETAPSTLPFAPIGIRTLHQLRYSSSSLQNDKLKNLKLSSNSVLERWVGDIERMGEERNVYMFVAENQGEETTRETQKYVDLRGWNGLFDSEWGQVAGFCDTGKESSGSIKCSVFLVWLIHTMHFIQCSE